MEDYQGNSKRQKEAAAKPKPEKHVEKIVTTDVVVKPKGLGAKFKHLIVEADFKSVIQYVISDVMIPAAKNMIVDSTSKGIDRMVYGEAGSRRRYGGTGTHVTYNNPINRSGPGFGSVVGGRSAPPIDPRSRSSRNLMDDIILSNRDEAEMVLETLSEIISQYEVASVADLKEMVGLRVTPIDVKWGWVYLGGTKVVQVRDGYLIDLPPAEPIS
jgi:hypothetical protein